MRLCLAPRSMTLDNLELL